MKLIKNKEIIEDNFERVLPEDDVDAANLDLPEGDLLVSLDVWKARRDDLTSRDGALGVWLAADELLDEITDDLDAFSLVALDFPHFKDGRSFSKARLLRERFEFGGEIRAVGDVQYDQLFFMQRVGFDAFEPAENFDLEEALEAFNKYSVRYQPGADEANPLYRQVKR